MSEVGIRPYFTDLLSMEESAVRELIMGHIEKTGTGFECKSFRGYLVIRIPESRRKIHSPRLILSLDSVEESTTRITGTFGPNANLWSAFLYANLLTGSVALFSGIFGFCQWKIGHLPWGLWIFWPSFLFLAVLYAAAKIGRRLGAEETRELQVIYQNATSHLIRLH